MAGDFGIRGVASLKDNVTSTLKQIESSLEEAGDAMEEANRESEEFSGALNVAREGMRSFKGEVDDGTEKAQRFERTLDGLVPEDETRKLEILEMAVEDMMDAEDISSVEAWEQAITSAGRTASSQAKGLKGLDMSVDELASEMSESTASAMAFREAVENSVPTKTTAEFELLSKAIDNVVEAGDIGDMEALKEAIERLRVGMSITDKQADRLKSSIDEVGDQANETSASMGGLTAATTAASAAMDELEDESDDAKKSLRDLDMESARLSADLGLLHISLSDLLTTLPELAIVLGPITKALGGLAIAAGGVGGAFAAMMGAGMLAWAEQLDAQFASIEGTGEALQVIMAGIGRALREAIDPLVFAQLADGRSVMEATMDTIGALIDAVHVLAVGFADILALPEVTEFFDTMGSAMLGANEHAGGLAEFMDALKYATKTVLPILTDLMLMIGSKIPDLMRNWADATESLGPELINFGAAVVDMMSVLSDLGIILADEVLPYLTIFFETLAEVGREILERDKEIVKIAFSLIFLALAISYAKAAFDALIGLRIASAMISVAGALTLVTVLFLHMSGLIDDVKGAMTSFLKEVPGVSDEMAEAIGNSTIAVVALTFAFWKLMGAIASALVFLGRVGYIIARIAGTAAKIAGFASAWEMLAAVLSRSGGILITAARYVVTLGGAISSTTAAIVAIIALIFAAIVAFGLWTGKLQEAARQLGMLEELEGIWYAITHPIETTIDAISDFVSFVKQAVSDYAGLVESLKNSKDLGWLRYLFIGIAWAIKAVVDFGQLLIDIFAGIANQLGVVADVGIKFGEAIYSWLEQRGLIVAFYKVLLQVAKALAIATAAAIIATNPILLLLTVIGWVIAHLDDLKSGLDDFVSGVEDFVAGVVSAFENLSVDNLLGGLVGFGDALVSFLIPNVDPVQAIEDIVSGMTSALLNAELPVGAILPGIGGGEIEVGDALAGLEQAIMGAIPDVNLADAILSIFDVDIGGLIQQAMSVDVAGAIRSLFDVNLKQVIIGALGLTPVGVVLDLFGIDVTGLIQQAMSVDIEGALQSLFNTNLSTILVQIIGGSPFGILLDLFGIDVTSLIERTMDFSLSEAIDSLINTDLSTLILQAIGGSPLVTILEIFGIDVTGLIERTMDFNLSEAINSLLETDLSTLILQAIGGSPLVTVLEMFGIDVTGLIKRSMDFNLSEAINSLINVDLKAAIIEALGAPVAVLVGAVFGIPAALASDLFGIDLNKIIQQTFGINLKKKVRSAIGGPVGEQIAQLFDVDWSSLFSPKAIQAILSPIDSLSGALEWFGQKARQAGQAAGWLFDTLVQKAMAIPGVKTILSGLTAILSPIGDAIRWVGKMALRGLKMVGQFFGGLLQGVFSLKSVKKAVQMLLSPLSTLSGVLGWVGKKATQAGQMVLSFFQTLVQGVTSIPGVKAVLGGLTSALRLIGGAVLWVGRVALQGLKKIGQFFGGLLQGVFSIKTVKKALTLLTKGLQVLGGGVMTVLGPVIDFITKLNLVSGAISIVKKAGANLGGVLKGLKTFLKPLTAAFKVLWKVAKSVYRLFRFFAKLIRNVVGGAIDTIISKFDTLIGKIRKAGKELKNSPVGKAVGGAMDIGGDVMSGLGDVGKKAGKAIGGAMDVGGDIMNGLGNAGEAVGKFAGNMASQKPAQRPVAQQPRTVSNTQVDNSEIKVTVQGGSGDAREMRRIGRDVADEVFRERQRRKQNSDGRR